MSNARKAIIRHLSADGTSSGSKDMAVDGSVTPVKFWFEAQSSDISQNPVIVRLIPYVRDNAALDPADFGGIGGGLTNGVKFYVTDENDVQIVDLLDGLPIKTNAEWSRVMYDVRIDRVGVGDDCLSGRWTFAKFMTGNGLHLSNGEKLVCEVQDDLSSLVDFSVTIEGHW